MIILLLACAVHDLQAIPWGATARLPDDDGPHDSAQTEWWHVHADLHDVTTGESLAVFAGFVVERTDLDRVAFLPVPLGVNPFHSAYVRLADDKRSWVADRENFPDFFSAGFSGRGALDLHHGDWRIRREAGALVLHVSAGPATVDLTLTDTRPVTRPGVDGRVALRPGSPHLWLQEEDMAVKGRWTENGKTRWVEGTGFAKHQWGRLYDPDFDGFHWFSADLPDGQSLSLAWLDQDGSSGVPGSLAWLSEPDGSTRKLDPTTCQIAPTRTWRSPRSGARWPVAWTVKGDGLDLVIDAAEDAQEIWAFPAPIWAGPAHFQGHVGEEVVDLTGFAEQAGASIPKLRGLFHSDPPPGDTEPPPNAPKTSEDPASTVTLTFTPGAEVETE